MAGTLRSRNRRSLNTENTELVPSENLLDMDRSYSDI